MLRVVAWRGVAWRGVAWRGVAAGEARRGDVLSCVVSLCEVRWGEVKVTYSREDQKHRRHRGIKEMLVELYLKKKKKKKKKKIKQRIACIIKKKYKKKPYALMYVTKDDFCVNVIIWRTVKLLFNSRCYYIFWHLWLQTILSFTGIYCCAKPDNLSQGGRGKIQLFIIYYYFHVYWVALFSKASIFFFLSNLVICLKTLIPF